MNISISAVVPMYNDEKTITRAIRSILRQTVPVSEIIAVDDGSTDLTRSIVEKEFGTAVIVLSHPQRRGAQAARKTGIRAAKGEWVALLDGDDEWLEDKIERQLKALSKFPEAGVIHGNAIWVDEVRKKKGDMRLPSYHGDIYPQILRRPGPMYQCMLIKKSLLEKTDCLDEGVVAYQEWDAAIALSKITRFVFIRQPLVLYYISSPDSFARDKEKVYQGYASIIHKYREEILRHCSPFTLAKHLAILSELAKRTCRKELSKRYYREALFLHPGILGYLAAVRFLEGLGMKVLR